MTDDINQPSTWQEHQNKELGIKLYPKDYFDISLQPWGWIVIDPAAFEKFCKIQGWGYTSNNDYFDITKISPYLRELLDYIKSVDASDGVNYSSFFQKNPHINRPIMTIKKINSIISQWTIEYENAKWKIYTIDIEIFKKYLSWDKNTRITKNNKIDKLEIIKKWNVLNMTMNNKSVNLPWINFSILDSNKKQIMTHDQEQLNIIELNNNMGYKILQTESLSIFGTLTYATMDNNNNFVVCLFEVEDSNNLDQKIQQLRIFQMDHSIDLNDPDSPSCLIEQDMIPEIQNILYVDDNDDIIVLDTDYQVRRIQTNMQEFPIGYQGRAKFSQEGVKVRKTVNKTLEDATALLAKGIKIDTDELATEEEDVDIVKLRQQIWSMSFEEFDNKTLKQLFDTSETVEDLMKVKSIVEAIKRTPEIAAVHGLLDPIESAVFKKYNQAKLDELYVRLDNLVNSLGGRWWWFQ